MTAAAKLANARSELAEFQACRATILAWGATLSRSPGTIDAPSLQIYEKGMSACNEVIRIHSLFIDMLTAAAAAEN